MRTMREFLTSTDGMSPAQIRKWYARLSSEEKLDLEIILAHFTDEHSPHPTIGASGMSERPDLNSYDRRFDVVERFACWKSRKLAHRIAGRND